MISDIDIDIDMSDIGIGNCHICISDHYSDIDIVILVISDIDIDVSDIGDIDIWQLP